MTCYLRLHEVAVHRDVAATDWNDVVRRWREAAGVGGRDAALASMPVTAIDLDDLRTASDGGADDPLPPRLVCDALFAGVSQSDLGPSFLYRHGWHRPPDGADVIAWRGDGTPGAYVERTTGGTILLHGGANLLATGTAVTSAARVAR